MNSGIATLNCINSVDKSINTNTKSTYKKEELQENKCFDQCLKNMKNEKEIKDKDNIDTKEIKDKCDVDAKEIKNEDDVNTIKSLDEKNDTSNVDEEKYKELVALIQDIINGKITLDEDSIKEISKSVSEKIMNICNGNLSLDDINKLKGDILNILKEGLDLNNLKENPIEELLKDITKKIIDVLPNEAKDIDIKSEIINVLKEKLQNENIKGTSNDLKSDSGEYKVNEDSTNVNNKQFLSKEENKNSNEENKPSLSGSDEDILKKISNGDKKDSTSKFTKAISYMNSLTKTQNIAPAQEMVNEAVTINSNTFASDIIKNVKFMEMNNMKEMTVKIMPKELGEVLIKLTMENGIMKANITANNKDAYNLLNSNLKEINDKMLGGEIKIQDFAIDIYNGDTTFFSNEKNREQRGSFSNRNKKGSTIVTKDEIQDVEIAKNIEDNSSVNAFV